MTDVRTTWSAVSLAIQASTPVLLWGPPGIGKSQRLMALGSALDLPVEVVIASIREPSDFAGLPVVHEGDGVDLCPPRWAQRLAQVGRGIVFLDELSCAPPAVQAALLRVVQERTVGDLTLPPGVAVVAAANPPEQAAGGWDLPAPQANRWCHLSVASAADDWCSWVLGAQEAPDALRLPEGWEKKYLPQARALVSSFIRVRPTLLLQVPTSSDAQSRAWPSPRTWEMASRLLGACTAVGQPLDGELTVLLLGGAVGESAAIEFLGHAREMDLPDPEELLARPAAWQPPKRGDRVWAALAAVTAVVLANNTKDRWEQAWKVLERVIDSKQPDVAAVAGRSLAQNRPAGAKPGVGAERLLPLLRAAEGKR